MLYKFLNFTHIKWHITGEAWTNFLGSYEDFISHDVKSLHVNRKVNQFTSHFS